MNSVCPLCHHSQPQPFCSDKRRAYFQCQQCFLVFADRTTLLSAEQEKAQYDLHQNQLDDPGYRKFLSRLSLPLLTTLKPEQKTGLDFGCGPGPLLAQMFSEAGKQMQVWDPFYAPEPQALQQKYHFVSCTEAIEHFINPAKEWSLWLDLLLPEGVLALMTKRYTDQSSFINWHYKNDPTHISFFHQRTFEYLAQRDQLDLEFPADDVVLFKKRNT
ncbi:MAG: class I SAM-dependent methyltransferase [Gammaproteobacteria bacterium]|nr:class I SAM-dependent methyltransferase [Gammaproteobacteria bacterium]